MSVEVNFEILSLCILHEFQIISIPRSWFIACFILIDIVVFRIAVVSDIISGCMCDGVLGVGVGLNCSFMFFNFWDAYGIFDVQ